MPVRGSGSNRRRSPVSSKGGNLKLNQNFSDRRKASKNERAMKKAAYLATLPKNRWKRLAYRLHPKRVAAYWFSREGAIMALKITGVGIVVCFFLIIGVFAYFRKDLPQIKGLSSDKLGGSITYYDRTGKTVLWQDYDAVKRIPVDGDQMSPYIRNATVAIEDKDFYSHGAFDLRGIIRAGANDVFGHGPIQGGSTITQQLVKLNEQWTSNRTITRKIKELILAVELEREYSKKDILTGYLNAAPYGGVEYGAEAAAQDYFHTSAKDLTLAQASLLAAIPKSPSYYSPYSSSEWNSAVTGTEGFGETALLNRQHYILDQMTAQGYVTESQASAAKNVDVLKQVHSLRSKYNGIKAPYFVLAAKQELQKIYGAETVQRGGWKVTTTLDLKLQELADKQVDSDLPTIKLYGGDTAAFVAEDVQTGQMVALVGGADFNNPDFGKINYAETPIPPGSSFKPYDYTAFIQKTNAGAGSVLFDSQGPLEGYPCTNKHIPKYDDNANCLWDYDYHYPGPLTLRYALGGSRNVPAVKANLTVGTQKVIDQAMTMMNGGTDANDGYGYHCYSDVALTKKTQCYGASAIGDGAYLHLDEHVNGLATLARLGNYIPRTYILKITDASNKIVHEWKQPKPKQAATPEASYILNSILSDPRASYLRDFRKFQHQASGWDFAVKTGTTNDNYDGLMTSWSTKYAVATWVGYHTRNVALTGGHMEAMTEPIVRGWMEAAHAGVKPKNWTAPSGIKTESAYVVRSGFGSGALMPSPSKDVFPSGYVAKSGSATVVIDKVSNKLVTDCTPALARETVGGGNANSFSVDKFVTGSAKAGSYTDKDDVHKCDDDKPKVSITTPPSCDLKCSVVVTVTAGTHPLSSDEFPGKLTVQIAGKTVGSTSPSKSPTSYTVKYTPTKDGAVTVSATMIDSVLYQSSDSTKMPTTVIATPPDGQQGRRRHGGGGTVGTPVSPTAPKPPRGTTPPITTHPVAAGSTG